MAGSFHVFVQTDCDQNRLLLLKTARRSVFVLLGIVLICQSDLKQRERAGNVRVAGRQEGRWNVVCAVKRLQVLLFLIERGWLVAGCMRDERRTREIDSKCRLLYQMSSALWIGSEHRARVQGWIKSQFPTFIQMNTFISIFSGLYDFSLHPPLHTWKSNKY